MQSSFHCLHKPYVYCQPHELTGAPCKILYSVFALAPLGGARQRRKTSCLFCLLQPYLNYLFKLQSLSDL